MNDTHLPNIEDEGINIKKYIFLILSHWWWFALAIFISLTIAYLVNRYAQEVYSASCSLIIGEEESRVGSIENVLDELTRVKNKKRQAVVENEISILKSYKLARQTLEELDFSISYIAVGRRGIAESQLYNKSPFTIRLLDSTKNPINYPIYITLLSNDKFKLTINDHYNVNQIMKYGEEFKHQNFHFIVDIRNKENFNIKNLSTQKYYFIKNDINTLSNKYRQGLEISVNDEKGTILTISLQGFVPEQLTNYLNKLSEVYILSNLEEKNITSENTIQFIDEQLNTIVDSLESTGLRLQQFRTSNKVIDLSKEGSFLYEKMQGLLSEKATYEIQLNYYAYLLKYIHDKSIKDELVAPAVVGINDNLLNNLVEELNKLLIAKRKILFSVSDDSPQIKLLNNQISNTINLLEENLQSLLESTQLALSNINIRIGKIDKEVQKLPGTERQLIDIQRKFTINDQIYTFLLEKRAEAGITLASNVSDHKILDIARPENIKIIKPKISMNYTMALLTGSFLPLILLLIIEFFNNKITDRKYLESNLQVPILGNIGHNSENTDLAVIENPRSSLAESFRELRTNLQYILQKPDSNVIAVTSAISGEGKTFCSVNLACILAMTGKKTLLVSLDLRKPKIHRIFNITNEIGISTYLINRNKYDDIIFDTNIKDLYIATSGPMPPNPSELIGTQKMKDFISLSKKGFDYVILDTPPIAIVTDSLILRNNLDAFIFVIRHNYSDKQVIDLANSIYNKHKIKELGAVVNDIRLKGYYGYSYRYGYGYGYGYGYSYSYREAYYDENIKESNLFSKIKKLIK